MTLLNDLRDLAAVQANGCAVEILNAANAQARATRFKRLRQRKAHPATQDELTYMHCTQEYAYHKIRAERAFSWKVVAHNTSWADYVYHKNQAAHYRGKMTQIGGE